jgi:hypothetical protein
MPTVTDASGKVWHIDGSAWIRSAAWTNQRAVIKLADDIYEMDVQKPATVGVWLSTALPERCTSFEAAALSAYTLLGG